MPLIDILKLLKGASFFNFAQQIDLELSERAREKGCHECGGKLHSARYQRKSRFTGETPLPKDWNSFYGLCCAKEGCRTRVRPESVRFAGQSSFSASQLLLAKLLHTGGAERSVATLCKELGISERTARRWVKFWRYVQKKSTWWRKLASTWSLSGKFLNELWSALLQVKKTEKVSFEYLLEKSSHLWCEIKFNVGEREPAEDA